MSKKIDRDKILKAYEKTGSQKEAAKLIGCSPTTVCLALREIQEQPQPPKGWLRSDIAASRLGMTVNNLYNMKRDSRYSKYFWLSKYKSNLYVDVALIEMLRKRKVVRQDAMEAYYDLLDHYGSEMEVAKAIAKESGKSVQSCYSWVNNTLFVMPSSYTKSLFVDTVIKLHNDLKKDEK